MSSFLVSILVLSTIFYEAQGICFGKNSLSSTPNHDSQEKGTMVIKGSICKDNDFNCSGLNRKLMTKVNSSTYTSSTTSKSEMNIEGQNGKEEILSVNPSTVVEHREVSIERFPDIVDIAGMDYSSARRKLPIHN